MAVDVSRTQDVYKDAGQSVNFTTLLLNRKDRGAELEVIQDMADRIQAIKRSVSIRANGEGLGIAFGFSRKAWDYLFPNAPVPKELEDFQGIKGDKQDVPAVAADLFLHVRSNNESVTYTVVDQIMEFLAYRIFRTINEIDNSTTLFIMETMSFINYRCNRTQEFHDLIHYSVCNRFIIRTYM